MRRKRPRGGIVLLRMIFGFIKLIVVLAVLVVGVNMFVIKTTENQIAASIDSTDDRISEEEAAKLKAIDPQCIMVLGASVNPDGSPGNMLRDRLDTAIELYHKGVAPKLLLTGDDGQVIYNEVQVMKDYAISAGVPERDIVLDHAGFSTYESAYRAAAVFKAERMIVVTQQYHLYRSLYGCKHMGIEVLGAASNQDVYTGQDFREIREVLARDKDFVKWIFKPEPTFLGEEAPVSEDGR